MTAGPLGIPPVVSPRDLEVELPGHSSFVRMAKLVVAGFASATAEIDEVRLAGLRMAVAETCQIALERRASADRHVPIRLRTRLEDSRLHVWVDDPAGGIDSDALRLAEVLVRELDVTPSPRGGTVAHLVVDTATSPDEAGR